jgi:two-component system chemotaxis response regulator CheY
MRTLIVEDEFTGRVLMQEFLKNLGPVDLAADGQMGVNMVRLALENRQPYDLICLDIMMPDLDGQQTLRVIREMEQDWGIYTTQRAKVVMTTSLNDRENVVNAYTGQCDGYLTKPISRQPLLDELRRLKLLA